MSPACALCVLISSRAAGFIGDQVEDSEMILDGYVIRGLALLERLWW